MKMSITQVWKNAIFLIAIFIGSLILTQDVTNAVVIVALSFGIIDSLRDGMRSGSSDDGVLL
jgi:hypothetical protein